MNIVLIGFMGCGKTTIGRKLAVRLGYRFIDTDYQIEKEQGCRVKELFTRYGETRFRELETNLLKRLINTNNTVISTGGGILLTPGNMDLIRRIGKSIYLNASIEDICERISRNNKRPLPEADDLTDGVAALMDDLVDVYRQADFTVDTRALKMGNIVSTIIRGL